MAEPANPLSTGSGGPNFEVKVQAAFVAAMLANASAPCVPHGSIESIRLQSRQTGRETDDALVTVRTHADSQHRLLVQIKHALTFTASDEEFRKNLVAAWRDFNSPEHFDKRHDAIAIASGPQSAKTIDHVRPVLEWARHCDGPEEFFGKVQAEGFSSGPKRSFIEAVREILKDAQRSHRTKTFETEVIIIAPHQG